MERAFSPRSIPHPATWGSRPRLVWDGPLALERGKVPFVSDTVGFPMDSGSNNGILSLVLYENGFKTFVSIETNATRKQSYDLFWGSFDELLAP